MHRVRNSWSSLFVLAAVLCLCPSVEAQEWVTTTFDFESFTKGERPKDLRIDGEGITVEEKDGSKVLAVIPKPGDARERRLEVGDKLLEKQVSLSAKIFASKRSRTYPSFGMSVYAGAFQLQVNPGSQKITLTRFRGQEPALLAESRFTWPMDKWMNLKMEVKPTAGGSWIVSAKAWPVDVAEPAEDLLFSDIIFPAYYGYCVIYALPYSEQPLYFDDVQLRQKSK